MNGKDLTDSVWNEHKEPQNDESTQPNEVSAFLSDLRLNQYIAAFTENGFETMHELKQLTNDDLKELGVLKMAHRKQIKNGISAHSTAKLHHKSNNESKENEEQIENETLRRKNVLVGCVGIAKYYELKDLSTANDIAMYRSLFEDKYNYKVIANDPSQPMNKEEMERFLRTVRKHLYDFIDDKLNYDALVVTFGGHGTSDSVICSDGSKFRHKAIRKIFFIDELKDIPKIFLIDACRTDDINEEVTQNARSTVTASTFSTTLMTSEGHEVYGAKICKFITSNLRDAYHSDQYTDFRTVYTAARAKIKKSTNGEQDLVLCEHDLDIDSVVFIPKGDDEARGSKSKRYNEDRRQVSPVDFLRTFLKDIRMERYYDHFTMNKFTDKASLQRVNEEILISFGIKNESHRTTIMKQISKLFLEEM